MMSEKISTTVEDYLVTIYVMQRDGVIVTGARLAELLGVTPPTVTNTLKRMARDGLITMDSTHLPHLTDDGEEAAGSVLRKHMLAEWMLNRLLSWSKLHKEAHELEHAISGEVESALMAELNNPRVCPHGNPFPGEEDAVSEWLPLIQARPGARGIVRRIHEFAEGSPEVLAFLEEKRVAPGQEVVVREVLPVNETLTLEVAGERVSLGFSIARYLYVELITDKEYAEPTTV